MFLSVRLFNAVGVCLLHLTIICLQQAYNSICCRRLSGSYPFSAGSSPSTPTAVTTASSSATAGVSIPINRARVHRKVRPTKNHLGISRHPHVLSFLGIPSKCAVWKKNVVSMPYSHFCMFSLIFITLKKKRWIHEKGFNWWYPSVWRVSWFGKIYERYLHIIDIIDTLVNV